MVSRCLKLTKMIQAIKQKVKSDFTKLNDRNKNFVPLETEFQNKRSKEEIVAQNSPNN